VTPADSTMLCCSAQSCVYQSDPGTMGLFCSAHWDMVGQTLRKLLRAEHERYGNTQRWLQLARLASEEASREESLRALAEERGYFPRPKFEARRVA
jgi:hypothetical protein